jgi:hypothetical protein
VPWLWLAALLGLAVLPAQAQSPTADSAQAIAPADIPAQADADEKFLQSVRRRIQMADKVQDIQRQLQRQASALDQLEEVSARNDLAQLSVQRLESLERHWLLKERALAQTRNALSRATNAASEDAAELASRRAAWQATRVQAYLSPALLQRADELVAQIDAAQAQLADPLAKLLDLGRKSSALSAQVQKGVAEVASYVVDQDRRLVTMDSPPLWSALRATESQEPVATGLRRSVEIEWATPPTAACCRPSALPRWCCCR